nr:G-protein coupled receptor 1 [Tanacetum cinerariifolium]
MTVLRSIGNEHGHPGHKGPVAAWCWTETERTGNASMDLSLGPQSSPTTLSTSLPYAPLWGAILFNGIVYFQVIRMLNNVTRMAVGMSDRGSQSDTRADMKECIFCIMSTKEHGVLAQSTVFTTSLNRVTKSFGSLFLMLECQHLCGSQSILLPGGLFNSIAYGLNSSVRRAIFERLDPLPESIRRWFPKKLKSRSQQAQHESELVSLRIDEKDQ